MATDLLWLQLLRCPLTSNLWVNRRRSTIATQTVRPTQSPENNLANVVRHDELTVVAMNGLYSYDNRS